MAVEAELEVAAGVVAAVESVVDAAAQCLAFDVSAGAAAGVEDY